MKRLTIVLITLFLTLSYNSEASIYGTLKGKVETSDGKPAVGATIQVLGTVKGAIVKSDGTFVVTNIESGEYEVKITFVGQEELIVKVRISANKTTEVTFKLRDSSEMTEEVVVIGDKQMVNKTQIGSQSSFTDTDIRTVTTNNVNQLVALSAGVRNSGTGYTVRGSRDNQTQVRVDGVDITDQFSGGFGGVGRNYFPMVSQSAIEEMQVQTGGFSSEFGSALGGVINTTVGAGRTNRIRGFVNYRTDAPYFNGSSPSNIRLVREDVAIRIENFGEGFKFQGANQNQIEFGIDGPIPFLKNSTFSLSTNNLFEQHRGNSYRILDPAGNNLGQLDNNGSLVRNITPKFAFQITPNTKVIAGGQWGKTNLQNNSWNWLYATDLQTFETRNDENFREVTSSRVTDLTENIYKQGGFELTTVNTYVTLNQTISEKSFFEISARYNLNQQSSGRLLNYDNPSYINGWEFLEPIDNETSIERLNPGSEQIFQPNQAHDYYEGVTIENTLTKDGFQRNAYPIRNIYSGFYEGINSAFGTANPYGINNSFIRHGTGGGYSFQRGTYFQLDGNYNLNFQTNEFFHSFRTGFEVRVNEMHRHANGSPSISNPVGKDIYSDMWGGNLWETDPRALEATQQSRTPWTFAVFVQDQIQFESILVSPGLRLDYFNPMSKFRRADLVDYFIKIEDQYVLNDNNEVVEQDGLFEDSPPQFMLSPRLNISYPITNRQIIKMNYGIYYKVAPLTDMFANYNINHVQVDGLRIGNPNMKPERVNSYEIGYDYQFSDEYAFSVNSYYKDIFNELGVAAVRITPSPYFQTTVSEYGNARGIEFEIRKARSNNHSFRLNYTLSRVMGTADNVNTNLGIQPDRSIPGLEIFPYPLAAYPLGRDIPHDITGIFNLYFLKNDGPSIAGVHILENFDFGLTVNYRSGVPFTVSDMNGNPLGERNADRFPNVFRADLKIRRLLDLGDIFGKSLKGTNVELYLDIFNVTNNRQAVAWNTATKDPDNNLRLTNVQIGQFNATPFYKEGNYADAQSFTINQYDPFGNRIYQADASGFARSDVDRNGIITQQEMFDATLKYYEDQLRFKGNYQLPITVFFGIKVNFQSLLSN